MPGSHQSSLRQSVSQWVSSEWVSDKHSQWSDSGLITMKLISIGDFSNNEILLKGEREHTRPDQLFLLILFSFDNFLIKMRLDWKERENPSKRVSETWPSVSQVIIMIINHRHQYSQGLITINGHHKRAFLRNSAQKRSHWSTDPDVWNWCYCAT